MHLNTTAIIVTFKSEVVINKCLKGIQHFKEILILDNSKDINLRDKLKKIYPNIRFFISKYNLGYSRGHNFLMRIVKTKYALLISPDVFFYPSELLKLEHAVNYLKNDFAILAPNDPNTSKKNYGFYSENGLLKNNKIYKVDYVHGFFMLFNMKKILNVGMFDKNFFLYNEDIDLCNRLNRSGDNIYIIKDLKVDHISSASSNIGNEYDKCKNWHWMWSKFYFSKKNKGQIVTLIQYFPVLIKLIFKSFLCLFFSQRNFLKNYMRLKGLSNSMLGNKSHYRPKIK